MRSIRRSLVICFLVLSGLALGAVSLLVYQTTERTLEAKQEAIRQLLLAQHDQRCRQAHIDLDEQLKSQAISLAREAQISYRSGRIQGNPLEYLLAPFSPGGVLTAPMWHVEGVRTPATDLLRRQLAEIKLAETLKGEVPAEQMPDYFQINTEHGKALRSASLEQGHDQFPFNHDDFVKAPFFEPKFDETTLSAGTTVRRVTLKVPVLSYQFPVGPPRPPPSRPPERLPAPAPDRPPQPERVFRRTSPAVLVQCAIETDQRDEKIAAADQDLQKSLAHLEAQSQQTLASLRNQLLLIALATFAATLVGSFCLIWLGLAPLQRLGEAVSRVSTRDFRLQLDDRPLPRELTPIVERLNETLDLLKRAFAREKQAAADISHELRTPLAALLTTIEVALRKQRTPQEYRELLEDCRASGQQMSQLVEHLLTLARLDAGVIALRPRPVDATQVARQCVNLVRPLAEARGLSLQMQCSEPASLTTDPDKLREVLTNLLHNAIEYNRPNGSVELTVARQNGHLRFEVRDSGIGIAPEAREHIFERFYRADPSRQADGLHAGLGCRS